MVKEFDKEDEKFERLLADKRHRELATSLKNIATILANKDGNELAASVNEQTSKIQALVSTILNTPKPDVNVELNAKEFVSSAQQICKDIIESNNKVIEALENRLLPDTFTLVRSYGGQTESVKVNYKQANLITIKK